MHEYTKDDFLTVGPKRAPRATLILAHGAGAPMDSDFMNEISDGLAEKKIKVVRFEFPYMKETRRSGKRKPPNSAKQLLESWNQVIELMRSEKLLIGGKSMGGRIASMAADTAGVDGVVCLGYPFHPPGKPENLRVEHLEKMKTPTLIVQGERDTFGKRDEVESYSLSRKIKVEWLTDGDHSFKPRKKSGVSEKENFDSCIEIVDEFVRKLFKC